LIALAHPTDQIPRDLAVRVNQRGVVIRGDATALVWVKVAITYLVPFANSNFGVLIANRRPADRSDPG